MAWLTSVHPSEPGRSLLPRSCPPQPLSGPRQGLRHPRERVLAILSAQDSCCLPDSLVSPASYFLIQVLNQYHIQMDQNSSRYRKACEKLLPYSWFPAFDALLLGSQPCVQFP